MGEFIKYLAKDGTEFKGEVIRHSEKDVLVFDVMAPAGSRFMFWLPRKDCLPIANPCPVEVELMEAA